MKQKKYSNFKKYYNKLYDPKGLLSAWVCVQRNAKQSESKTTLQKLKEYEKNLNKNLENIRQKLKSKTFVFKALGAPVEKKQKNKYRPVVSLDFDSRIVQRRILDVLQSNTNMKPFMEIKTSFGGIKNRGVKDAVSVIHKNIKENDFNFYLTTDIESFFTKIKIDSVIKEISSFCKDKDFIDILEKSLKLEIENLSKIQKKHPELVEYYNYTSEGVPQGSCLSPLFGNIYLNKFDKKLNSFKDIICLRYLDDVIILGKEHEKVNRVFHKHALPMLKKLGLNAYTPTTNPEKSSAGTTQKGFNYLGVNISNTAIRPDSKSLKKIKHSVHQLCLDSLNPNNNKNLFNILNLISGKIKGWGNHYFFCNSEREFKNLDEYIDKQMAGFIKKYLTKIKSLKSDKEIRKLLGIHELANCKHIPIIQKKKKN